MTQPGSPETSFNLKMQQGKSICAESNKDCTSRRSLTMPSATSMVVTLPPSAIR